MFIEEIPWHQFKQLNNIRKLPLNEQVQYYNRYLNELSTQRTLAQIGAAAGGDISTTTTTTTTSTTTTTTTAAPTTTTTSTTTTTTTVP